MSTHEPPVDPTDPEPTERSTVAEGMGTSNERVGPSGPGQVGTTGVRDTGPQEPADDVAPEQSPGGEEVHPDPPVPPVAGYNSHDPRSEDHPFESRGPAASEGGT
jgi:hypothetical protein